MRLVRIAVVRRIGIVAVGAALGLALLPGPVAASTDLPESCASASNPQTGQTIQVCGSFEFVNVGNSATGTVACYAQSGPISVNTTTSVGCYLQDRNSGMRFPAPTRSAPGNIVATAGAVQFELGSLTFCVFGSAVDAGGNTVSLAPTCF